MSLISRLAKLSLDHAPTILTTVGATGTVVTAYLTGRASFKAAEIIREEDILKEFTIQEKAKLVWKEYIPAIGTGVITVVCIIAANRVSVRRAAALAAAYSISEKAFAEYKSKVKEKIGENKERAVRDEIAQDRVTNEPPCDADIIDTGKGSVLFYDSITGRYFRSDMETVRRAQDSVNHEIMDNLYAPLSYFYNRLYIPSTPYSHEVGWNTDHLMEITFSATITEEEQPCICVEYRVIPIREYRRIQ